MERGFVGIYRILIIRIAKTPCIILKLKVFFEVWNKSFTNSSWAILVNVLMNFNNSLIVTGDF